MHSPVFFLRIRFKNSYKFVGSRVGANSWGKGNILWLKDLRVALLEGGREVFTANKHTFFLFNFEAESLTQHVFCLKLLMFHV